MPLVALVFSLINSENKEVCGGQPALSRLCHCRHVLPQVVPSWVHGEFVFRVRGVLVKCCI